MKGILDDELLLALCGLEARRTFYLSIYYVLVNECYFCYD